VITEDVVKSVPKTLREYAENEIIFRPHPGPQTAFLASSEDEVFYGGARGGGKSFAMLVDPLRYCHRQKHRALFLRRTMPELRDIIENTRHLYPKAFPGAKYREQEKEWRFPSGARIEFGFAENMADVLRYQGQSYTWIGVDELPQYPEPDIWNFLRSSLRSVDPEIPTYMRATGNPGNAGSWWVRAMFIDPSPWGEAFSVPVNLPNGRTTHISRRFIPAKLTDNPSLMQTDQYMIMLASLPETQRKQFLEGDWDVFDNMAFPDFDRNKHVVSHRELPRGWIRFRACDWGYTAPAACLWFAIDYDGNLWVYRELYVKGKTADIFARMVVDLERNDENLRYGVLDVSTWAKRGDVGPSIAETMIREGCKWRPSDRSPGSRKNGKLEVHRRFRVKDNGEPSLYIFSTCTNLISELSKLPLDDNDPEDVDTDAPDHAYDALRYGCMSRPIGPVGMGSLRSMSDNYRPADNVFGY
jgi:hypothetical protein